MADITVNGSVVLLLLVWVLPAALVANYARNKGYDVLLFLLFALLATWLVAWIVALLLPPRLGRITDTAPRRTRR